MLEVGLGVQQLVLRALQLLGQVVAAGTRFPENLFDASDFVFMLGENLSVEQLVKEIKNHLKK